jgi:hypothetical protein
LRLRQVIGLQSLKRSLHDLIRNVGHPLSAHAQILSMKL